MIYEDILNIKKENFIECPFDFDPNLKIEDPSPIFRRKFEVSTKPESAVLEICGLGYGCYFLNGNQITEDLFIAPVSDYNKTLWYNTYDITEQIKIGENQFAVILGNGFFNEAHKSAWDYEKAPWRGNLKFSLSLKLKFSDHTEYIFSDDKWKCNCTTSYIRFNQLRSGEYHDYRFNDDWKNLDFDDSNWDSAVFSKDVPSGVLRECKCQPIHEKEEYSPINTFKNTDGMWVIDFGQNMSGYLKMCLKQPSGDKITIRYAERLFEDGRRDDNGVEYSRFYPETPYQTDSFICSGERIEFKPKFVYHGFRYVIIDGLKEPPETDDYKAIFVHQDVKEIGKFHCSDEILNKIDKMGRMSTYSNLFYSVTDCPTREKLGWCNDARASAEQMLQNFDIVPLYKKWIQDMYDVMSEDGKMPGIVPTAGWGYEWGHGPLCDSALFEIPYKIYRYYDDSSLLIDSLPYFKRYLEFADSHADENNLIGFGLRDWAGPFKDKDDRAPLEFTDTMLVMEFYRVAKIAASLAKDGILEKTFSDKEEIYENAIRNCFYDKNNGRCKVEEQTAVAMMIINKVYDDIEPLKQQLKELIEERDFHHHCGMLGLQYLYFALDICGLQEYAYKIITVKSRPSYYEWIENDATTMWEKWNTGDSKNHHMYSSVLGWFNRTLVGLNLNSHKNAFKNAVIKPVFINAINNCFGEYETAIGKFSIKWEQISDEKVLLEITTPATADATLELNGYVIENSEINICKLKNGKNSFICSFKERN